MAGCVAWCVQHDHAAVAKDVLVSRKRFNFATSADPVRELSVVDTGRGRGRTENVPVAFADEQRRLWERAYLASVVAVVVTHADELHLIGRDLELREQIYQRGFRCS